MDMGSQLWHAVGLGRVTVTVEFHPPVTVDDLGSRKALSDHCQARVAAGVAAALTGRPMLAPEGAPATV